MTSPSPAELLGRGYSVIPLRADKKPYFSWKEYQTRRPSVDELKTWEGMNPPAYAVITGKISGIVTFDFDGEKGVALAKQWSLRPHRRTGSGGLHLDVVHPGWPVPTLNSRSDGGLGERWPGLDVRADGGYVAVSGRNMNGPYECLRDDGPDPITAIPPEVWEYLHKNAVEEAQPTGIPPVPRATSNPGLNGPARVEVELLTRRALEQASADGRNNSGFWLAAQLRDNGYSEGDAMSAMRGYASRVAAVNMKGAPERYTDQEALASVREAYSRGPREPWTQRAAQDYAPRPRRAGAMGSGMEAETETPTGPPDLLAYHFNDSGNAERLIALHGEDLLYCHALKNWQVWDGKRFVRDETGRARKLAKHSMLEFLRQAVDTKNEAAEKFARLSLDNKRITNLLSMAEFEIYVTPAELDEHPYLLNFTNGTVDLRNGELRPHNRADLITKLVHYDYRSDASYVRWQAFLDQIMGGGADAGEADLARAQGLTEFLQRAAGYSLTGVTTEKAVFVLFGEGDNGKSTMLSTFRQLIEEYSTLLQVDSLMVRQESNNTQADLADLRGARFVQTSETEEGQRLAQGKLKRITQGMGKIKAVRKYENPIEFSETHKLWLDTNRRPSIKDADDKATFNRLHPIPFTVRIPKDQIDRDMSAKLLMEAEGILAWAVAGAKLWYESGLKKPPEVEAAKNEWRTEMDQLGRFVEERCVVDDSLQVAGSTLYADYKRWTEESGEREVLSGTAFGRKMPGRGFAKKDTKRGVSYLGIALKNEEVEGSRTGGGF